MAFPPPSHFLEPQRTDMPCYHTIKAYILRKTKTENGKSKVVFRKSEVGTEDYRKIELPCGKCIGCRLDKSREWAVRCVHEAQMHHYNSFITLTFCDGEHHGCEHEISDQLISLRKRDFQLFMKRLRKEAYKQEKEYQKGLKDGKNPNDDCRTILSTGGRIRYFHCGEYGSQLQRPHHHACLFGCDFSDKTLWNVRDGVKLYRSSQLEKLWPYGFSTIGEVTFASAAYVARYVTKKINGKGAAKHYGIKADVETGEVSYLKTPEYVTMSRRPGIGKEWFEEYASDCFPSDFITIDGIKLAVPRYYLKQLSEDVNLVAAIQERRMRNGLKSIEHQTGKRLRDREKVKLASIRKLERTIE